jgi:hypothetical protein
VTREQAIDEAVRRVIPTRNGREYYASFSWHIDNGMVRPEELMTQRRLRKIRAEFKRIAFEHGL